MVRARSKQRNKTIYSVLMVIVIVSIWAFQNFYTPDTYSVVSGDTTMATSIPTHFMPGSTTGAVTRHRHFTLSYSEPHEQAEWVAYLLKKEHLTYDDRKRPYFIEDPKVRSKSADWRNYKGSGYDRGHLCPAGDRRFSEQAYNETFYTSNISPQDRDFNAGVWNRLEQQVRRWAKKEGALFVVTGGVLTNDLDEIGGEDVAVPNYYYKIIASGTSKDMKVLGFLIKGEESSKPLREFVVTVDEIEKRTGIDFFQELPDKVETVLESKVKTSEWKF